MQKESSSNNRWREKKILQRDGGEMPSGGSRQQRRGDERGHGHADSKAPSRNVAIESILSRNAVGSSGTRVGTGSVGKIHEEEKYGFVMSLRTAFGFIQSIFSDEQLYFSDREYYANIKANDTVGFKFVEGPKGPAAQNVRLLIPQLSKLATNIRGTVIRSGERHRSGCGLIEVTELNGVDPEIKSMFQTKFNNQLAFRAHDVIASSLPKNHYLDRGDVVTFSFSRMHDSNFFLASDVTLKQLKREKVMSDQIQRMLDAGVVRELGVISTVKNREYGFIKAQDRKDEIFFRLDDVTDANGENIKEGVEVEFFVIAEMIRGKLCDRATCLKVVPTGTVQFEVLVGSDITVTVTTETGTGSSEESPGVGKLSHAIDVSKIMNEPGAVIKEIDLWQRCLPDDLIVRKGDTLSINVHYYRPEKIFFARSARVHHYLLLGRDTGIICAIKDNSSFGFISSDSREIDLYFRLNTVVDSKGKIISTNDVKKGSKVTFDVIVEDGKFRAVRVQLSDAHNNKDDYNRYVLKKNVSGTIIRHVVPNKKGSLGYVELTPSKWREINDTVFLDPQLVASIANFMNNDTLQSVEIHGLPVSIRRAYYDILDKLFPTLHHESVHLPSVEKITSLENNAIFKTLKIWKAGKDASKSNPENAGDLNAGLTNKDGKPKGGYILTFGKDDFMNDGFGGPLPGNVEVIFDVCWDRSKGRKVAKSIRLTDEVIPDMIGDQRGVIDVLFEKGVKHGILRMIPSDESIMFSAGSIASNKTAAVSASTVASVSTATASSVEGDKTDVTAAASPPVILVATPPVPVSPTPAVTVTERDLKVGGEVIFELRKRGGYRYAMNVRPQITEKSKVLPDLCIAIVVDTQHAILIDVNNIPELKEKYLDCSSLERLLQVNAESLVVGSSNTTTVAVNKGNRSLSLRSDEGGNASLNTGDSPVPETSDAVNTPLSTGIAAIEDVDIELEASSSTASKRIPSNASYFPPLLRQAIPIKVLEDMKVDYKVGDLVVCACEVQFTIARMPIHLIVKEVLPTKTMKKVGKIQQLKLRIKPDVVHTPALENKLNPRYNYTSIDFMDIVMSTEKGKEEGGGGGEGNTGASTTEEETMARNVYCLYQEISILQNEYSRELLKNGTEVDFWVIPSISKSIAFGVNIVIPKDLIMFSRGPGINDKLKELKHKAGQANLITMAEGPSSETAKGFAEGWRSIDKEVIANLPWATLLSHLQ